MTASAFPRASVLQAGPESRRKGAVSPPPGTQGAPLRGRFTSLLASLMIFRTTRNC